MDKPIPCMNMMMKFVDDKIKNIYFINIYVGDYVSW